MVQVSPSFNGKKSRVQKSSFLNLADGQATDKLSIHVHINCSQDNCRKKFSKINFHKINSVVFALKRVYCPTAGPFIHSLRLFRDEALDVKIIDNDC